MRIATFALCFGCAWGASSSNAADPPPEPTPNPALFKAITTVPAHPEKLKAIYVENHDGDGEGEELPASVTYFKPNSKEFGTFMTITDSSLCKRPLEKKICQGFAAMISGPPPALGKDVSGTRIGGSGYGTVFFEKVPVDFAGVDSAVAFLGGDSQDPPLNEIVLYIYAKRGTNLIQLASPVAKCAAKVRKGTSDSATYQRCVDAGVRAKAAEVGKTLTELFVLAR